MEVSEFDEPYEHFIFRNVVPDDMIDEALSHKPRIDSPAWIRYENELEYHKWTMEDRREMPPAWIMLASVLENQTFIQNLSFYTGIGPLQADASKRGAGLHLMFPNGYLQTHLDYALHPSGLERRVNVILSVQDCAECFGGACQLCDTNGNVKKKIYLKRNEALVWACSDVTYHGVEPLAKEASPRITVASYYLGRAKEGISRTRALFVPRR